MTNRLFYLKLATASALALITSYMLTTGYALKGVIGGLSAFAVIYLIRSASVESRKKGRTSKMKLSLINTTVLTELVLLLGAFSLPIVPKYLAVITLTSVGFVELLKLEGFQQFRTSFSLDVGRNGRIVTLGLSLIGFYFNDYLLFYGLVLLSLLAVYDSLRIIHQLREEL